MVTGILSMTRKPKWKYRCRKFGEVRDQDRNQRSIFASTKEIRCTPCVAAKDIVSMVYLRALLKTEDQRSINVD